MFLFNAVKFLILFGLAARLFIWTKELNNRKWITVPTVASLFVAMEIMISTAFRGSPWFYHFFGYTQTSNIWFLQLAELGGVAVISWLLVMLNLFLAAHLAEKKRSSLIAALTLVFLIHGYGMIRIHTFGNPSGESLKLALICDNSPPELRWNEAEVNNYVHRLFGLNHQALSLRPDMIVWNENVIPWSYRYDDDFLNYILGQGRGSGTSHLISYFSEPGSEQENSSVSAYLIYPNGQVAGRYDKSELLAGVEKPLFSSFGEGIVQLPFALDNTLSDYAENPHPEPISSSFASIGVMICNESFRDMVAGKLAKQGVNFMVLMSNNAWVDVSTIVRLHFFYTRMRAVENRSSIAINSNKGISGLIAPTGKILMYSENAAPHVLFMDVPKTKVHTNYLNRLAVFQILVIISLLIGLTVHLLGHKKPECH